MFVDRRLGGHGMTADPAPSDLHRAPPPRAPARAERWARRLLALRGWRVAITWPPVPRCVIIVYPHTSNWDFVIGYLARVAAGLPVQWIGKDTLFRWPVAGLLRRMGGVPVDRRRPTGIIAELAAQLQSRDQLWLALAPEGTRARTDHWKSGFYHLALAAKVPVGLAFIDYRTRVVGLDTYLTLSGDEEADLARIRAVYAGKVGKHPEQASDIRLRPEAPTRSR
ncbi:MAG TPA: lysophospholipid acyltransferase family protein [Anaeromyxobacteraceae bacterium]